MEKRTFRMRDFIVCVLFAGLVYWLSLNLNYLPKWLADFFSKLLPLTLGAGLAFIINIPTSFIERRFLTAKWGRYDNYRKHLKRPIALLVSLFFLGFLVYAFFALLLPELNATLLRLSSQIPRFVEELSVRIQKIAENRPQLAEFVQANNINIDELIEQFSLSYAKILRTTISSLSNIALSVISSTVTFVISLVFAIYIILGKEQLGREITKLCYAYFSEEKVDKFLKLMIFASKMFARYISAICLEAVILSCLVFTAMSFFAVPYATLVSVVVGILALIPIFGAYLSAILGFILILTVNYHKAFLFLPMFLIIQQIEGNLIYPFVVGSQVGLPAIWVFLAVLVGGNFFGLAGLLISVPLAAVLYVLIKQGTNNRTKQKAIAPSKLASAVEYFAVEKDVEAVTKLESERANFLKRRFTMPSLPHVETGPKKTANKSKMTKNAPVSKDNTANDVGKNQAK